MKIETFIFVHDQDIILNYIKIDKFYQLPNVKYIFVGKRDTNLVQHLPNVIICRNLPYNIEQFPRLTAFTGWYAVTKNHLIQEDTDYVNLFEYDVNLEPIFKQKQLDTLELKNTTDTTTNIPYDAIMYIDNPMDDVVYLRPDIVANIVPLIKEFHNINILQIVKEMIRRDPKITWPCTSNSTFSVKTFHEYVAWFERFLPRVSIAPLSGHEYERSISLFFIIFNKKYIILHDILRHLLLDSHDTQALGRDWRTTNLLTFNESQCDDYLDKLASKYHTDKKIYGFCQVYQSYFHQMRYRVKKILEIGVLYGDSLLLWKEYFPNAVIHGIDTFTGVQGNGQYWPNPSKFYDSWKKSKSNSNSNSNPKDSTNTIDTTYDRIELYVVDVSSEAELKKFVDNQRLEWESIALNKKNPRNSLEVLKETDFYDIIIDDGSHRMYDQQLAFKYLFPLVKLNGHYVIECLQSSYHDCYDVEKTPSNEPLNTTYKMLTDYNAGLGLHSKYVNLDHIQSSIDFVKIHTIAKHSELAVLKKKPHMVYFVSFGNEKFKKSRQRIELEAKQSGYFDHILIYDEQMIQKLVDYDKISNLISKYSRGYGYWSWKPLIMSTVMREVEDQAIIFYADAGCSVIQNADVKMKEYLNLINAGYDNISFEMLYWGEEARWTKMDIFHAFNVHQSWNITHSGQLMGGIFMIKKTFETLNMIKKWFQMAQNEQLITDSPSQEPNFPIFKENRHDQSIFSILRKLHNRTYPVKCLRLEDGWTIVKDSRIVN